MTRRNTVIELTEVGVEGPLLDGTEATFHQLGLFTSFAKAEDWLRRRIEKAAEDDYALRYYEADEVVLDIRKRVCRSIVYDQVGNVRGDIHGGFERPWGGRESSSCKYTPGELVGFVAGAYRIGVVLGQPISPEEARRMGKVVTRGDDVYLIGLVDPRDPANAYRYDHEHMAEPGLFDPPPEVSDGLRTALQRRCQGYEGFPPWESPTSGPISQNLDDDETMPR